MKRSKTFVGKSIEVRRNWHLIDLSGKILGRTATVIVKFLTGKAKPSYTPHVDAGDYVVAINADKIVVTGRKLEEKLYHWHTGHPQGFRTRTFKELTKQDPRRTIKYAVAGMLPKNKLRPMRLSRLKIFSGGEHPYQDKIKERPASE